MGDELDALAPSRGRNGDSGGVMDRVVSQLLVELDGANSAGDADKQVFVIAASNRADLVDRALLRPGRFDKLIYVGITEDRVEKMKVLQAQLRKLKLSTEVLLGSVIDACPSNMTGADMHALAQSAAMNAVRRAVKNQVEDHDCCINQEDLLLAASELVPSVSVEQMDNYKRIAQVMGK